MNKTALKALFSFMIAIDVCLTGSYHDGHVAITLFRLVGVWVCLFMLSVVDTLP